MRSYVTGEYSILKDGNWKLHINRMDWDKDVLVVPDRCSDLHEFLNLNILSANQIIYAKYGENAYETRKKFWRWNLGLDKLGLDIVTDMPRYYGEQKFYNNFNITKDPNNPRWYIDEFIEDDVSGVVQGERTYVLNQSQKDYLVELEPTIEDKIEVNQRVIRKEYFDKVGTEIPTDVPDFDIFFPFRLSDPAYKFEEVVEENPNSIILITDPNDSYQQRPQHKNVVKYQCTKRQYYGIIDYYKPKIIYKEDPSKVFHPGLADFIYFACDIRSPYEIPTLQDVLINGKNNIH